MFALLVLFNEDSPVVGLQAVEQDSFYYKCCTSLKLTLV